MKTTDQLLDSISNKTLLSIFPHPDDETVMAGGLIQQALKKGWRVVVVCLTLGEGGRLHIHGNGKSLSMIRSDEYGLAMKRLGVTEYALYDLGDGKLKQRKNLDKLVEKYIDEIEPGLVVTYDMSGVTGHPDHITLGLKVFDVLKKKKIALIWPTFIGKAQQKMVHPEVVRYLNKPSLKNKLHFREILTKWWALKAHKSQAIGKELPIPLLWVMLLFRTEYFAVADFKKEYSYKYPEYDLGLIMINTIKGADETV